MQCTKGAGFLAISVAKMLSTDSQVDDGEANETEGMKLNDILRLGALNSVEFSHAFRR